METLWAQIQTVLWNVFNRPTIADVLDILIVAFLLYELLMLTRKRAPAPFSRVWSHWWWPAG